MLSTDIAVDIIKALIKGKKNLRLYPENNPIYTSIVDDIFTKMSSTLEQQEPLQLRFKQYEILYDGEVVYHNKDRDESLALFFFKDGIREITFLPGIKKEELQAFLKIIAMDFEKENSEDDIVTLFWERDFHYITYTVDDAFLVEDENYEDEATEQMKNAAGTDEQVMEAYADAFRARDVSKVDILPLTDDDINAIMLEIAENNVDKTHLAGRMLVEMHFMQLTSEEYRALTNCLKKLIVFALGRAHMNVVNYVLKVAGRAENHGNLDRNVKTSLTAVYQYVNSAPFIKHFKAVIETGVEVPPEHIREFSTLIGTSSIPHLTASLADMESISTRRTLITILTEVGKKDLALLAKGLKDSRWYLVRNLVYVFRQIGDKSAVQYLAPVTEHKDKRVRKEVVYALGEMGTEDNLKLLKKLMSDGEKSVRIAAIVAAGRIGSAQARQFIIEYIGSREFIGRDLNEKKEVMQVVARWNDPENIDFLTAVIRKRKLFGRSKNNESRAAALFCLGLMGEESVLPLLKKYENRRNRLISRHAREAIRTLTHGTIRQRT